MAEYTNDLRLKEIATGDEDGTWGTSTNTNLELIADAFSYGTEQLAADADETFTMADGAADSVRALYLKITSAGSLTTTRVVTLAPNTVSKVWIIENATTGSQSITISQGSGGTVTIPTGAVKMVYTDGAGAGAAVTDALVDLSLTTPALGTPSAIVLTNATGLPVSTGISGLGTNVATALAVNVGSAGAFTTFNGALGTPSSGTLTNCTGLPVAGGGTGASTLTLNNVILGNGTSAVQFVAPGTSGNVLTSNGTTWASSALATVVSSVVRSERTSNTILGTADKGTLIDITSGTFTQTFDAVATLTSGWWCYYRNSGTGDVTLDPNGAETIDGLTSYIMYPGEVRLIQCNGTNLITLVVEPFSRTYTTSDTFTKPPGYTYFGGIVWGAGGAGGKGSGTRGGGGGGGGAGHIFTLPASSVGTTESVTIAAAVTGPSSVGAGGQGGASSLGTIVYGYGGGGGHGSGSSNNAGGGGGGSLSAGTSATGTASPAGGNPLGVTATANSGFGGGAGGTSAVAGYTSHAGGAGGGGNNSGGGTAGGASVYGGGGGGGSTDTGGTGGDGAGGTSVVGGAGGAGSYTASGVNGTAPGGGGGGTTTTGAKAGDGARGELRIWGVA